MQNRIDSLKNQKKENRAEEISSLSYTLHKIKTQKSIEPKGELLKKIQIVLNQNATEQQLEEARYDLYKELWEHENSSLWKESKIQQEKSLSNYISSIIQKISNTLSSNIMSAHKYIEDIYTKSIKKINKIITKEDLNPKNEEIKKNNSSKNKIDKNF